MFFIEFEKLHVFFLEFKKRYVFFIELNKTICFPRVFRECETLAFSQIHHSHSEQMQSMTVSVRLLRTPRSFNERGVKHMLLTQVTSWLAVCTAGPLDPRTLLCSWYYYSAPDLWSGPQSTNDASRQAHDNRAGGARRLFVFVPACIIPHSTLSALSVCICVDFALADLNSTSWIL